MSPWDPKTWKPQSAKRPPPARGIKVSAPGTTWWGKRWIEALVRVLSGDEGRLGRGRTYARAGRVHDLTVERGVVTARVTGSRDTPYEVTIALAQLADGAWSKSIARMAEKAQFAAALLAGEMPKDIDAAFRDAGASLFPERRDELETSCSCPDWGDPCKHVAATHYVLGEAFDRDPFLLFELRGRKKTDVLDRLRAARRGEGADATSGDSPREDVRDVPRVALGAMSPSDYDRPPAALPSLQLSFDAPSTHAAVLRQLGAPAAWNSKTSPADALGPLVARAAEAARRIALGETEPAPDDAAAPPPPGSPKRPSGASARNTPRTRRGRRP